MEENNALLEKRMNKGEELTEMKHEKIGAFAKEVSFKNRSKSFWRLS